MQEDEASNSTWKKVARVRVLCQAAVELDAGLKLKHLMFFLLS